MKISVDPNSTIPLHMQLLHQLRHLILSGQWSPGSRILSETELRRQLNISRSTIRQAFRNAESEGLIERVPGKGTFVARQPAGGGSQRMIGYVTVDLLRSDLQYQWLSGAEHAAKAKGYRIVFCNSGNDIEEENRLLDQLVADKVAGILIWPVFHTDSNRRLFQLAHQKQPPLMLIDRTFPNLACDCVTSRNNNGAYTVIQHLLDLGHRRIVFLSKPVIHLLTLAERLRGYRQAMQDVGLTPLEPWLVGTPDETGVKEALNIYGQGGGPEVEQIKQYLQSPNRPTAIFAANDPMALIAFRAASEVGLHVPKDLSIVGFDNMDITAHLEVPLTTVSQDCFKLGRRAAELLIERIEGYSGPPRHEKLPIQLRVRASTIAPATNQQFEHI